MARCASSGGWSGREDLNLRPQRPERCALTGLRYSPRLPNDTTPGGLGQPLVYLPERRSSRQVRPEIGGRGATWGEALLCLIVAGYYVANRVASELLRVRTSPCRRPRTLRLHHWQRSC